MTVQLPFEQADPLEIAPLLRQLQQDGVMRLTVPARQLRLRRDTVTGGLAELPVEW